MNEILRIKQDSVEELEETIARYPVFLQAEVKEAFQAAEVGDIEKAVGICCKLLDYEAAPGIRMLLGSCYFVQGNMPDAEMVYWDLTQDYPEKEEYHVYHGITNHALGRYKEAVKELGDLYPLSVYRPFYYTSYGDSLQQIGRLKQSCDVFREEVAYFEKTGNIVSAEMLDGAFQNLLHLDVKTGNGRYQQDVKIYYDFLNQAEMTERMQENLAGNIIFFSEMMHNRWYRPLFLEFVNYIKDRGFLTTESALEVLESAFASWESYGYHDDNRISAFMEAYLVASYRKKYGLRETLFEEERGEIEATFLTYEWYMCQYVKDHSSEIDYVRENYPYTYADNRDFFEKIKDDADGTAKEVLDVLYEYAAIKSSREEFTKSMYNAYTKACENRKDGAYVYDGTETYRRMQAKVGRNDPCPCGSGKKYKKCCGK